MTTIYKTSGTASSYYYEDQTALPGQYYDYKVVSITTLPVGHHQMTEAPEETLAALRDFLAQ